VLLFPPIRPRAQSSFREIVSGLDGVVAINTVIEMEVAHTLQRTSGPKERERWTFFLSISVEAVDFDQSFIE